MRLYYGFILAKQDEGLLKRVIRSTSVDIENVLSEYINFCIETAKTTSSFQDMQVILVSSPIPPLNCTEGIIITKPKKLNDIFKESNQLSTIAQVSLTAVHAALQLSYEDLYRAMYEHITDDERVQKEIQSHTSNRAKFNGDSVVTHVTLCTPSEIDMLTEAMHLVVTEDSKKFMNAYHALKLNLKMDDGSTEELYMPTTYFKTPGIEPVPGADFKTFKRRNQQDNKQYHDIARTLRIIDTILAMPNSQYKLVRNMNKVYANKHNYEGMPTAPHIIFIRDMLQPYRCYDLFTTVNKGYYNICKESGAPVVLIGFNKTALKELKAILQPMQDAFDKRLEVYFKKYGGVK